ncbi:MAG: hypothetical protein K2O04_01285 [Clostridiales bacterium]|nr:hypothetical protein [Clostridiales bacterium]
MTKLRNKIVLVLLALCIVACLGLVVACGGDTPNDGSVTYTVIVKAGDDAAEGVQVTVKKGNTILGKPNQKTDKNGKVEFKLAEDAGYTVTLTNLPDGYTLPEGTTLEFGSNRKLEVSLSESFAYKIKLVNPDGSAFTAASAMVGICTLEGNCLNPVFVDKDGVGKVYNVAKTDYHVQVLELPADYGYECDGHGYSIYKNTNGQYVAVGAENTYNSLSATKTETTVTIYPVNVIDFKTATALTAEQIAAYKNLNIKGSKAYKFEVNLDAGATAYYTFTSDYDGEYIVYAADDVASYKLNETFLIGDSYLTGGGAFNKKGHYATVSANENYYLNVTNNGKAAGKAEFIIAAPAASKTEIKDKGTVKAVINQSGAKAVVALAPEAGAAYKLTVKGGAIKQVANETEAEKTTFAEADYKEESSCTAKFTEDMKGQKLYFAVSVKADTYPATVDVTVEKVAELKNETKVVTTTETLVKYNRPADKELIPMPLDGSVDLVLGKDKYYHIGNENGPIVVVNLTGNLEEDRFSAGGALVYMELATDGRVSPYTVDVTVDADKANIEKGKTFNDYRNLLRGFDEYKYNDKNEASIPNDITVDKYYAKYANEDGVYPLTAELRDILEKITSVLASGDSAVMLPVAEYEYLWMFACSYYDDIAEADAIVGDYKFVKYVDADGSTVALGSSKIIGWDDEKAENILGTVDEEEYKLVVTKRNKFVIYHLENDGEYEEYQSGAWSKDGEAYKLVVPNGAINENSVFVDLVYSVVLDLEEASLSLAGSDNSEWSFMRSIALLTEDEKAKLELYGDKFKFYQKEEGEGFVQYAYGKQVGGDEESPEIEFIDKHDSVKNVELKLGVEINGEGTAVLLKVKVSYTDDTVVEYVFDMTDVL